MGPPARVPQIESRYRTVPAQPLAGPLPRLFQKPRSEASDVSYSSSLSGFSRANLWVLHYWRMLPEWAFGASCLMQ